MKTSQYLQKNSYNILATIIITLICHFLYHLSGVLDDTVVAAKLLKWLPIAIGVVTIMTYYFAKLCNVNWAWKMTVLGAFINILLVLTSFFSV